LEALSRQRPFKVGFVGLGVMGRRMAKNLIQAGYEVVVYNRSPQPVAELVREGAVAASSPEELARSCRTVVLALLDSKAVEAVVLGKKGLVHGLAKGGIVIDTSTIDPGTAISVAEKLRSKGMYFLDAPVSGGPEGAAAGTLSIMVGGDKRAFEKCRGVLSKIGKNIFYLGGSGSGLRVKLFNQALVGVYFVGITEAYLWAKKMGMKVEDLQKIISMSWGDSPVFRHFASVVISGELKGGASMRNLKKDLGIILESATKDGVELSLAELASRYISKAVELGYEDYDTSALYLFLDKVRAKMPKAY
jgi:3-hydroxyisobutyrate dehydrogenase-like beta-hydroxyacid dehydrogenase